MSRAWEVPRAGSLADSRSDERVGSSGRQRGHRGRAALELLAMIGLVETVLWLGDLPKVGFAEPVLAIAIVSLALVSLERRLRGGVRPGRPPGGVAPWRQAWVLATVVTLAAAAALLIVTRGLGLWESGLPSFHGLGRGGFSARWWGGKLATIVAQQAGLHLFLYPLCHELLRRRWAGVLLASGIFGALHLPNPPLTLLTASAAPLWCLVFVRTGRLAPLVVSHLLLALLARGVFGETIYSMRVGAAVRPLLPHVLVGEGGAELRVTPRVVEGFVDGCHGDNGVVTCSGWSADVDRGEVSASVAVLSAGRLHYFVLEGLPRPDVARYFGVPEIEKSGFRFVLPPDQSDSPAPVRFFGVRADGVASELHGSRERTADAD